MRFVLVGLGGVGGVLAVRLQQAGHQVVGIARGDQLAAVHARGLRLQTPTEVVRARVEVVAHPVEISFGADDVVVLATKSQDTSGALHALASVAPPEVPVLCAQNGVANEPSALRVFPRVYGVVVMCPTAFLEPGTVRAYSTPITGLLDVGRYPAGEDDLSTAVAAALASATYDSRSISDVRRWKYAKLLTNLGNGVEAVCGPASRNGPLTDLARAEGAAVLKAAGIEHASVEEDRSRRGDLLALRPVDGEHRPGGSVWQSVARRADSTEVDYLNGEVVLLGRLHAVPTPVNAVIQRLVTELARSSSAPGWIGVEEVLGQIASATG